MIDLIETYEEDKGHDREILELDFSDTELSPYTLQKLIEELGYEDEDTETNGWQWDFWTTMKKKDHKDLCISGTGITFELKLSMKEE